MRERRVLELVHQDVLHAVVEREQEIGRRLGRPQGAHGALRHLGEVDLAALAEYHLEVRRSERQQLEDRLEHLPLVVGVALGRHVLQRDERLAQTRDRHELGGGRRALAPCALRRVRYWFAISTDAAGCNLRAAAMTRSRSRAKLASSSLRDGADPAVRSHWSRFASINESSQLAAPTLLSRCASSRSTDVFRSLRARAAASR